MKSNSHTISTHCL